MRKLTDISVVIFDMDGTLYQEDTFVERYIAYMMAETEEGARSAAALRARALLTGDSPIRLGQYYHREDDVVLVRSGGIFANAYTWEGEPLEAGRFAASYASMEPTDERLLYLGDPWGVVNALRHKHRIPLETADAAFRRVREEMLEAPYAFPLDESLLQAVRELDGVTKVLMTNTYEQSALDFLRRMGLDGAFDDVVPAAEKPAGIAEYMDALVRRGIAPSEILSIGDNPWNDLLPAKRLGALTCCISPYELAEEESWDIRVHTVGELAALLRELREAKRGERSTAAQLN
ncbi:HAD family hydrolase [Paenibacillus sp.]|uniref:HAD family hydrolase n=1 Tax=Paenibacillus sp. TaxID=58172 RepID=UPI002D33BB42|nr:HAD family hydrolase [Paenibacillus sp.]HZG87778.1 HAD family hydrolase [Paenibacillus sp.]